ncbi:PAS domain-containing protein [Hymenobacter busanensis]|uniref:histidine kinase n=1 Tax=Hymenobacter busanensis TaxID=2607656 RepID=A0A7L5A1Y1_9BACT|nr:PAS domain-containing protein [Hymenobacter busanensis]KAA9327040.1 PAS domain-containing protein [Hymenobacter busanensis]QHJ09491.1 PAS domain-containing protein [Hymenobacter busanensis]
MADFMSPDYQKLFRALPDNFLLIAPNPEATIVDNTDSHVAVSLKSREEVVGKPFFEAFPSANQNEGDVIRNSHEHVRRHLEPHTMPLIRYDLKVPDEQGGGFEEMYWQATHFPILDDAGQLQYILQRTQNVTEQYHAAQQRALMERELADSQERTRFILDSLPVLIWTAQPNGQRDYFNPRWLQFTGRTVEASQGQQWADDIHPDDRARVLSTWQQCVGTGDTYQVEYRLRRHDGQYRWVLVRGVARRNAEGAITMWVGGATDIHDTKLMVQELLEANEAQAAAAEQAYEAYQIAATQREALHTLLMEAPAMICILRGPEHRFDLVNPLYQTLFPHRQLLGRTVAEALPEVVGQGFVDILDKVYTTGETFFGKEVELQLERDASGALQTTYFNFTYQQFREGNAVAGILVFAFEVTDLVRARRALGNDTPDVRG